MTGETLLTGDSGRRFAGIIHVPASRTSTARKASAPPAAPRPKASRPSPVPKAVAAPEPTGLTAPRPGRPTSRDFSPSVYLAARPFCLTRPATTPQALAPAPADNLVRSQQDLVVKLGQMPIELAAPMLRADLAALDTPALLALVRTTGEAHHAVIARRKRLDWRVVKAIIRAGHEIAILTLAENPGVVFDEDDRAAMSVYAETMIMVRGALLNRPGFLFATAGTRLNTHDGLGHANLRLVKLARAGRHAVFVRDAARRLHMTASGLAAALSLSPDVSLALVTCALGMDQAVFMHLLALWHSHHGQPHNADAPHKPLLLSVFALTPAEAQRKLSAGLGAF